MLLKLLLIFSSIFYAFWRIYRWWKRKVINPFKEGSYAPKHTHKSGEVYINISEKENKRRKNDFQGGDYVDYEDVK